MTNKKTTKRALVMSVLSLVLCVSMFVGTTFAWFTDEVVSSNNIIKSGSLDVKMLWSEDNTSWKDASTGTIFDYQYWEPGYTDVKYIKIQNVGDLALKFRLDIIPNVLPAAGAFNLADVIDVYMLPAEDIDRSDVESAIPVGTLSELITDPDGAAYGALLPAAGVGSGRNNGIDAPKGEIAYCIVLKMRESADNNYQNLSVGDGFKVRLLATQYTYEEDSFDEEYDEGLNPVITYLFSGADLNNSTTKSGSFYLDDDITTSQSNSRYGYGYEYIIRKGADYTLDLNGKSITFDSVNKNANHTALTYLFVANHAGTKLTINGEGDVYCSNSEGYTCAIQGKDGTEITVNGGDYLVDNGIAVWAGAGAHITINGGSFTNQNAKSTHELIYSSGGVIDIYGGFFHNTDGNYTLNVEDRNRATSFINVYGGTYVNFDPSTGGQDPNNIKVAEGYVVVEEKQDNGDTWYTVVPVEQDYTSVATPDELATALNAGEKVVLEKDMTLPDAMTISADAVIDLSGRTLSTNGLNFANGATITNGIIESADATQMVPHLKISNGALVMDNVVIKIDDYLNYQSNGSRAYGEYTGLEITNATAVLNNCSITVESAEYRTWNYLYGITVNNSDVTLNGGQIIITSAGAQITDLCTAVSAIGPATVTMNNVDVQAETLGTTMGHLILKTTDATVTAADFVSYGGTYELNILN